MGRSPVRHRPRAGRRWRRAERQSRHGSLGRDTGASSRLSGPLPDKPLVPHRNSSLWTSPHAAPIAATTRRWRNHHRQALSARMTGRWPPAACHRPGRSAVPDEPPVRAHGTPRTTRHPNSVAVLMGQVAELRYVRQRVSAKDRGCTGGAAAESSIKVGAIRAEGHRLLVGERTILGLLSALDGISGR